MTRSSDMAVMAAPTAKAMDNQPPPKRAKTSRPIKADRKWPPRTFAGCDRGDAGTENNKTQLAPKGAMISGTEDAVVRPAKTAIPKTAPSPASRATLRFGFGKWRCVRSLSMKAP